LNVICASYPIIMTLLLPLGVEKQQGSPSAVAARSVDKPYAEELHDVAVVALAVVVLAVLEVLAASSAQ
jgi:hypothetical protein